MITKIIEEYLSQIHAKQYSIVIINPLNDASIISNMSKQWEMAFIKRKLHLNSNIVLEAKKKITPFRWAAQNIDNEDIRQLSEKYNIHCGLSFVIKIKTDFIIFTIYFDKHDKAFLNLYSKRKHQILFDVLSLFEDNYVFKPKYSFTSRETEIMNLLKIGKTYSEIAIILDITERTVRFHINNMLNKLEVTSVRYAIFKAIAEGLI